MKPRLHTRRTTRDTRHSGIQSPASLRLCVKTLRSRRGATLLVTLGILTVLSVMAVTFLVATRLQQQTAAVLGQRLTARNQLNEALHLAMRTVENAFCTTNFTDAALSSTSAADTPPQRLAPVGRWFSQDWENRRGKFSADFSFQAPGVLTLPISNHTAALQAAWSVNLFTPEVLALVPPALTNGLPISSSDTRPLRSGWELIDAPAFNRNGTRIAFAVFDVSGFLDANHFLTGPTTQKLPRVCFSQADVTNWFANVDHEKISNLKSKIPDLDADPNRMPFSVLSYDPNPDADPFIADSTEANPRLGFDLYALSRQRKFEINAFTNLLDSQEGQSGDWTLSAELMGQWLRPVASALTRSMFNGLNGNGISETYSILQIASIPWNMLNAMDEDRVPQLSLFAGIDLATRHNAAVEDVPLINKVTVFDIGEAPGVDHDAASYYGISNYAAPGENSEGKVSNHYAVAVELWYPFTPHSPPPSCACYAGVYTNRADVGETTFDRPLTTAELRAWFLWNEAATSNSVMQTLFYAWADAYTHAEPTVWQHPLWQIVTTNADAWFTTNMVNHPSWPVPDATGHITITNTPIWHAFYPETYEVLVTNQVEQIVTDGYTVVTNQVGQIVTNDIIIATNLVDDVTTNVYTYANTTNAYVQWVAEPQMTTNRLSGQIGVTDPEPYPVLLWSDPETSLFTTNVFLGFIDSAGATNLFFTGDQTNHLQKVYATPPDGIYVVSSNGLSGAVSTNSASALFVAPWTPDAPLEVSLQTNLVAVTVVEPLPPLPMPPELGDTLDALFGILLAPELSLDTSSELYDFLTQLPSEFEWWDFLDNYLALYPLIQTTIVPSHREPALGNLSDEDRVQLTEENTDWRGEGEPIDELKDNTGQTVGYRIDDSDRPNNSFGTYWVIYPRKTVSFREVTIVQPAQPGQGGGQGTPEVAQTNYCFLGSQPGQTGSVLGAAPSGNEVYRVYFRPVVTVIPRAEDQPENDAPSADNNRTHPDRIVDEALLDGNSVRGWNAVTNLYVADPRHNAYADYWLPNASYPAGTWPVDNRPRVEPFSDWDNFIGTTNLSTEVTEYPFVHLNRPLTSIGEIGHIYTSPDRLRLTRMENAEPAQTSTDTEVPQYDTISFATRPGAALLDLFTVRHSPSNGVPWRGLVQANTYHPSVVETLFADAEIGWTNLPGKADVETKTWRILASEDIPVLTNRYINALSVDDPAVYGKSNPAEPVSGAMGWRSFADMLPAIMTNPVNNVTFTLPEGVPADFAHDWLEDAVRHLPDRVSFRQNIFVVVIAAQALSPASTPTRPVVLADQRAAVTVIRDAYTGRWTIQDWIWLTE